jgi:hypothetical protein
LSCYAISKACYLGSFLRAFNELGIDIECQYVTGGPNASSKLNCRVPGAAAEVHHNVSGPDVCWSVEIFGSGTPLVHCLVACKALRVDINPVFHKQYL